MSTTTIKIDGQPVGLRFGYRCLSWLIEAAAKNKELFTEDQNLTDIGMAKLLQLAHKNDCLVKEIEPIISIDKFYDWVEERIDGENRNELAEVIIIWSNSTSVKRMVDSVEKKSQPEETSPQTLNQSNESVTVSSESGPGN